MKILLIEDDNKKYKKISHYLKKKGVNKNDIIHARNMTDFSAALQQDIGLFIIDFYLPNLDNGEPLQNGKAILESIIKSQKQDALLLAISSYPDEFPDLRIQYESYGCILSDFKNETAWKLTLDHLLIQLKKNMKFDFIIFCALQEELNPYLTLLEANQVIRSEIAFHDIEINKKKGTVVLLPQMGLINAAITASLCIERYKPSIVGMSGICGGFEGQAKMGQLLISSLAYEYQSGKWASDGFMNEPYQVSTDNGTLTKLKMLANKKDLILELEKQFPACQKRPSDSQEPKVGVFTSGSAVIADKNFLAQIQSIHRKVSGLDMEIFAIHRAAELSTSKPTCICAKTVVDLCDDSKNDSIHLYGSFISAKFMILAITDFFPEN